MSQPTSLPWEVGYGEGLTGPTTPAIGGVTVSEEIQYNLWKESGKKEDYPYGYHIPIRHRMETVAIVPNLPGGRGQENAEFISTAVNHHDLLVDALSRLLSRATRGMPEGSWNSVNEPEIYAAWSLLVTLGASKTSI